MLLWFAEGVLLNKKGVLKGVLDLCQSLLFNNVAGPTDDCFCYL